MLTKGKHEILLDYKGFCGIRVRRLYARWLMVDALFWQSSTNEVWLFYGFDFLDGAVLFVCLRSVTVLIKKEREA
jgi:hypothetical protein